MRHLFIALLLSASPLSAQQPPASADTSTGAAAEAPGLPQYVWITEQTELKRWLNKDGTSANVNAGRRVEVILESDDFVRVRSGTDFGWIARDKLSLLDPNAQQTP